MDGRTVSQLQMDFRLSHNLWPNLIGMRPRSLKKAENFLFVFSHSFCLAHGRHLRSAVCSSWWVQSPKSGVSLKCTYCSCAVPRHLLKPLRGPLINKHLINPIFKFIYIEGMFSSHILVLPSLTGFVMCFKHRTNIFFLMDAWDRAMTLAQWYLPILLPSWVLRYVGL
jgi:hypothetical protein